MNMLTFGERLKELRQKLKLTQKEFVKDLSITPSALSLYEKGGANPSISVLKEIANKYNVSTDWLLGINENLTIKDIKTYGEALMHIVALTKCKELEAEISVDSYSISIEFTDETFIKVMFQYNEVFHLYRHRLISKDIFMAVVEKLIFEYSMREFEDEYN